MGTTVLSLLMVAWGVVTAVLVLFVIYRATLSTKEDDQVFIDVAEQHHYQDQQIIIARMTRLRGPIIGLSVLSIVLLLTSAGIWIYTGLTSF